MAAPSVAEAAASWLAVVRPLEARQLPAAEALGCVLAADAIAPHDLPPFPRAMMDGYAIRLPDAGRTLPLAGSVHAGDAPGSLPLGSVLGIMTGAPVPTGAEAVVQRELCVVSGSTVQLPERIRPQANIVPRGGEALAGATVLRAGEPVTAMAVAVAASLGIERLSVVPRPRVVVITTGAELRQGGSIDGGAIRDSNGPMVAAMCAALGMPCRRLSVVDDPVAIRTAIVGAEGELIVLTGGVSAGDKDFVPAVLAELGYTSVVRGVDQKPGKPLLLAAGAGRLVAALPGNPLAVHWCFTRFVAPALRVLMGQAPGPETVRGVLAGILPGSRDRPWFVPVGLRREGGRLMVKPMPPVSSGDVVTPAHAAGYVAVAAGSAPIASGAEVEVILCVG